MRSQGSLRSVRGSQALGPAGGPRPGQQPVLGQYPACQPSLNCQICHTRMIRRRSTDDPGTTSGPRYKQLPEPYTVSQTTLPESRAIAADAAKRELPMPESAPDYTEARREPRVRLARHSIDGGAPRAKDNGRVKFSRRFGLMLKIGRAGPDMALRTEIGAEPHRPDSSLNMWIFGGASNHRAVLNRVGVGRQGARRRTRYVPCSSSRPSALPPSRPRPRSRNVARVLVERSDRRSVQACERKTARMPVTIKHVNRAVSGKRPKTPLAARAGGA